MPTPSKTSRIAVYWEGEEEHQLAKQALQNLRPEDIREYSGVIEGWVTSDTLQELENAGLIVEKLRGEAPDETVAQPAIAAGAPDDAPAARALGALEDAGALPQESGAGQVSLPTEKLQQLERFRSKARQVELAEDGQSLKIYDRPIEAGEAGAQPGPQPGPAMMPMRALGEEMDALADVAAGGGAPAAEVVSDEVYDVVYQVQMDGPMSQDMKEQLEAEGAEILGYEHPHTYTVYINSDKLDAIEKKKFVRGVKRYSFAQTITPSLLQAVDAAERVGKGADGGPLLAAGEEEIIVPETYDVSFHRVKDCTRIADTLQATEGVDVLETHKDTIRIKVALDPDKLQAFLAHVARLPEVRLVTPFKQPTLMSERCRKIVGITSLTSSGTRRWTGKGETVAVIDTGVDANHPDLKERVVRQRHWAGSSDDDIHGHGTHVAGTIAGTGKASRGRVRGIAPEANIVAYRMIDDAKMPQWPLEIESVLQAAFDDGARIINLSWSDKEFGNYNTSAERIDEFVYQHPEVVVVIAAGNEGKARPNGTHQTNTVGGFGTAKNAITVGASASNRKTGLARKTWGALRAAQFSVAPASGERLSGNVDIPSAESGRGPTDIFTIKPDIVAPGTQVLSTWSTSNEVTAQQSFWSYERYPKYEDAYAFLTGTSMATPVVAGAVAVLRQYLREGLGVTSPSAALLKAILIASARKLPSLRSADSSDDYGYPDFDQGYGRLDLSTILPSKGSSASRKLLFADVRNGSPEGLMRDAPIAEGSTPRASRTYLFRVPVGATEPLRIVLTWTDSSGRSLMSVLRLNVKVPSNPPTRLVGNTAHFFDKYNANLFNDQLVLHELPPGNNVEQVVLPLPLAGEYEVRIIASNTVNPPQGFALCVCGDLESDLILKA